MFQASNGLMMLKDGKAAGASQLINGAHFAAAHSHTKSKCVSCNAEDLEARVRLLALHLGRVPTASGHHPVIDLPCFHVEAIRRTTAACRHMVFCKPGRGFQEHCSSSCFRQGAQHR